MMSPRTLLEHGRLLDALGYEAELLVEASRAAPPDEPVPTCPGWTTDEVVRHVGNLYHAVLSRLVDRARPRQSRRAPVPGQTVQSFLREGLADLREVLARHDPVDRATTWWDADPSYGFWSRRMVHETTVHRVDVADAAGLGRTEIAADMAVDGVDEALTLWFGHRLSRMGVTGTRRGRVAVRTGGHTWIVRAGPDETVAWRCFEPDGFESGRREYEGPEPGTTPESEVDAVVSGTAMAVFLWLWGRQWPGLVTVDGDDDAVGQLWALMRLATR